MNGMGRLPCSPVELQETPNTTQDAAANPTIIFFIQNKGKCSGLRVNGNPVILLRCIDSGVKVDPCQITLAM